jgi:hypothetical protein
MFLVENISALHLNKMQRWPYFNADDQDGPLPPSSPLGIQPLSPLTVPDESQGCPTTMHPSSPLSSPPESPALCSVVQLTSSLAHWQSRDLSVGGSEDSFVPSSPIRGRDDRIRKARKRRDEERNKHATQVREDEGKMRTMAFKESLNILMEKKLTFAELTEYVLFHEDQSAKQQCESFLADKDLVTRMLNLFISSKVNKACQRAVKDWAESTVQQAIVKEVNAATRSGDLQMTNREINSSFASGLGFEELKAVVRQHCPLFLRLLVSIITTGRQIGSASKKQLAAKEHVRIADS